MTLMAVAKADLRAQTIQAYAIGKKQKASKFSNDWCPKGRLGQQIRAGDVRCPDEFIKMLMKDQKENRFHPSGMRMGCAKLLCLVPKQNKSYFDHFSADQL